MLLSGRGSNFEALADSVAAGRIRNAEIAQVLSNREGAPGIERAKARGLATRVISSKGLEREAYDRQVVAALREANVELVCLAGYMGTVWLAQRNDGRFERRVAVKVLNVALMGKGGEERFRSEGRILGRLTHPQYVCIKAATRRRRYYGAYWPQPRCPAYLGRRQG